VGRLSFQSPSGDAFRVCHGRILWNRVKVRFSDCFL
jgi:hypothetical protein